MLIIKKGKCSFLCLKISFFFLVIFFWFIYLFFACPATQRGTRKLEGETWWRGNVFIFIAIDLEEFSKSHSAFLSHEGFFFSISVTYWDVMVILYGYCIVSFIIFYHHSTTEHTLYYSDRTPCKSSLFFFNLSKHYLSKFVGTFLAL